MEHTEERNLKSLERQLEKLLAEEGMTYAMSTGYPITITVQQDYGQPAQMSLLEEDGPGGEAGMVFVFAGGEVEMLTAGRMSLPEKTLDKIKGLVKKIHYAYLQWYFLDVTRRRQTAEEWAAEQVKRRLLHIYDVSVGSICLLKKEAAL